MMGRAIVTPRSIQQTTKTRGAPGSGVASSQTADRYSDALLKLIPVEVIGLYLSMSALAVTPTGGSQDSEHMIRAAVFLIGALITFFYLKVYLKVPSMLQVLISVGAFCVWALAINSSGPDPWLPGRLTGILVLVYTFVAPKIPIDGRTS